LISARSYPCVFFRRSVACLFVLSVSLPAQSAVNFLDNSLTVFAGSYEGNASTFIDEVSTRTQGVQLTEYAEVFDRQGFFVFPGRDGTFRQIVTIDALATTTLSDDRIGATWRSNVTKVGAGNDNSSIRFGLSFEVLFEVIDEPATVQVNNTVFRAVGFEFDLRDAQTGSTVVSQSIPTMEVPLELGVGTYGLTMNAWDSYSDLAGGTDYDFTGSFDLGLDLLNSPTSSDPPTSFESTPVPEPTSMVMWLVLGVFAFCRAQRRWYKT